MATRRTSKTKTLSLFGMNGKPVSVGSRIEIPAYCDLWMMGAKYGEVKKTEHPDILVVRMDNTRVKGLRRFLAADCRVV